MFKKLSITEHLILLLIYKEMHFTASEYEAEFRGLYDKTLLSRDEKGYFINTRGIAFLHQQRDPFDTRALEAQLQATSIPVKKRIIEGLKRDIGNVIGKGFDKMVNKASKIDKHQPSTVG